MMNNQRFDEAKTYAGKIEKDVDILTANLRDLPTYISIVRKYIPKRLEEIYAIIEEMKEKDFPDVHRMEKIRITDVKRRRDNEAVKISESMEDLFEKITNQNFVPVVDDNGIFIGIVTRKDVLLYLAGKLRNH